MYLYLFAFTFLNGFCYRFSSEGNKGKEACGCVMCDDETVAKVRDDGRTWPMRLEGNWLRDHQVLYLLIKLLKTNQTFFIERKTKPLFKETNLPCPFTLSIIQYWRRSKSNLFFLYHSLSCRLLPFKMIYQKPLIFLKQQRWMMQFSKYVKTNCVSSFFRNFCTYFYFYSLHMIYLRLFLDFLLIIMVSLTRGSKKSSIWMHILFDCLSVKTVIFITMH